jgi:nucleotide-binding universal stress UspA family protein
MHQFRRIFVAIDFSPPSDEALRQAYQRALSAGAKLAVCHIVPDELRSNILFPHLSRRAALAVPVETERAAKAVLNRVAAVTGALQPEPEVEIIADHGIPYAEILRKAEEWNADLIVVGSHGMSEAAGVFLGSVSGKIIQYAHSAVLIARPQQGSKRIIAGTDLSDPALPAISAAVDETRRINGDLIVVYCIEISLAASSAASSGLGIPIPMMTAEDYEELKTIARERLEAAVEKFTARANVRIDISPAAISLVRIAKEERADMLVVGTVGRTGFSRVLLGNVAETVASTAPCSVLVVRKSKSGM